MEAQPQQQDGHAGIASLRRQFTDEGCLLLLNEMELLAKLKECDNRKLLWLAKNTKAWKEADLFGVEAGIYAEIENRLYPEYDGENVTFQNWGWLTKEGEIRYLPDVLKEALSEY